MPYFQGALGTRLHYLDWGSGPAVVFSHGWSLGADSWEYQMLALSERGVRCVAHDRRGCGSSDRSPAGYDFDTFADDLAALLEHLDLDDVTVVAHSMGAGEVARMLTRHGTRRVGRVALIAPITPCLQRRPDNPDGIDRSLFDSMIAGIVADRPGWMTGGAELFFGRNLVPDAVEDRVIDWGRNLILRSSPHATVEMVRAWSTTDFRGDLASFTMPTLVVHGDADQIAPFELTGRRTAAGIAGSRLVVYPAASHGLFVTHRDPLNDELASFVEQRPRGTR